MVTPEWVGELLDELHLYREDQRIEAKEALGGLPESLWETYSAFANADGGVILLGVRESADKTLRALDILDPQWLLDDFWRIIRDPRWVSVNILTEEDVRVHRVDGGTVIAITIPRAQACRRPVFIGTDPYRGTYRRVGEADIRCTREEVDAMLVHSNVKWKG